MLVFSFPAKANIIFGLEAVNRVLCVTSIEMMQDIFGMLLYVVCSVYPPLRSEQIEFFNYSIHGVKQNY